MSKHLSMTRARTRSLLRGGTLALGVAAVGIGVLAAPASAAEHNWSGVAQCESGGNWNIASGNGYYGGLQFSSSTWLAYGGGSYAARADQATPAQQIAVAEKVLAGQGVGAWPTCGKRLTGGTTQAAAAPAPARAAAPAPVKAAAPAPGAVRGAAPAASSGGTYTVRAGDTLASIAASHGKTWQALHSLNRSTVTNPNAIYPGQQLAC
jgi:LysM repeat protein